MLLSKKGSDRRRLAGPKLGRSHPACSMIPLQPFRSYPPPSSPTSPTPRNTCREGESVVVARDASPLSGCSFARRDGRVRRRPRPRQHQRAVACRPPRLMAAGISTRPSMCANFCYDCSSNTGWFQRMVCVVVAKSLASPAPVRHRRRLAPP